MKNIIKVRAGLSVLLIYPQKQGLVVTRTSENAPPGTLLDLSHLYGYIDATVLLLPEA